MEATAYETLLFKVYGTRPESRGIDADMYRRMLDEYQNLVTRSMYETHQERIEEFKKAFVIVRDCVQQAIVEGAKKIMHKAVDSEIQSAELMAAKLDYDFFDRFELKQIISQCNVLFSNYGMINIPTHMFSSDSSQTTYVRAY